MEHEQVREAIQQLPLDFREVILLREFEELSYREIATILDCPAGDVRERLEISINLSPVYGSLLLPLFVFCAYPVFWQRNRTPHAARCVTHDLTIQAW
jgi:hypothetical protein